MDYEGKVTNVDYLYWYFDLNNQIRVHMSIMVSQNLSYKLPEVGSKVSIKNAHRYASTFVACASSTLNGTFNENVQSHEFISFVRTFRLGAADLIMMDKCLGMLDKHFKNVDYSLKQTITQSLMVNAMQQSVIKVQNDHICLNKIVSHMETISVSSCRFVKVEPKSYPQFPFWSFGVNNKPSKNCMLFGFLEIQNIYGFFMLKDCSYQMACVIYNCTGNDLVKLDKEYVLIEDYRVITEIFSADGVPNLEYMIVDFAHIRIMTGGSKVTKQHTVSFDADSHKTAYQYSIEFELKRKSHVLMGTTKEPEYYLHILITAINGANTSELAYLIFPKEYVQSLLFLEENGIYKLYHNKPLEITKCFELTRIANHKTYQIAEQTAHLQVLLAPQEPNKVMTVEECKNSLTNKADLFSFKGVVKQKRFSQSFSSRTIKRTRLYGFGTPGSKVNQLVFSYTNSSGKEIYLDCYMNNWENIVMPLGLIPEMEVIIRNVATQSHKYLKATVFTTFEIVSYRPAVEFQSVNLYENIDIDWGPRYFLGQGNKIPFSVLIWGRVSIIQVLSVKLTKTCKNCKLVLETSDCCNQCGEEAKDINFLSKLHVSDVFGQSKVLVKDTRCMKVFLDLQEKQWNIFSKAFEEIGNYSFNMFEADDQPTSYVCYERDAFRNVLTKYLTLFNKCALGSFDLKCRKLDSNPLRNGGRPLWYLVDIRKN